jgi:hypothetical protein
VSDTSATILSAFLAGILAGILAVVILVRMSEEQAG